MNCKQYQAALLFFYQDIFLPVLVCVLTEIATSIRAGDWKLVTLNAAEDAAWELYDTSLTRTETANVATDHPERVAELKQRWTQWAKQANVLPWPEDRE